MTVVLDCISFSWVYLIKLYISLYFILLMKVCSLHLICISPCIPFSLCSLLSCMSSIESNARIPVLNCIFIIKKSISSTVWTLRMLTASQMVWGGSGHWRCYLSNFSNYSQLQLKPQPLLIHMLTNWPRVEAWSSSPPEGPLDGMHLFIISLSCIRPLDISSIQLFLQISTGKRACVCIWNIIRMMSSFRVTDLSLIPAHCIRRKLRERTQLESIFRLSFRLQTTLTCSCAMQGVHWRDGWLVKGQALTVSTWCNRQ